MTVGSSVMVMACLRLATTDAAVVVEAGVVLPGRVGRCGASLPRPSHLEALAPVSAATGATFPQENKDEEKGDGPPLPCPPAVGDALPPRDPSSNRIGAKVL